MSREPMDDVDRLMARLEPIEPPADLVPRVLTQVQPQRRATWQWAFASLATLALLGLAAFALGQELGTSGTLDLLSTLLLDWEPAAIAPTEYALAVVESLPWFHLIGVTAMLVAVYACSRLLRQAVSPRPMVSV